MNPTNPMPNSSTSTTLIAFFRDREKAYEAIEDLQQAGFSQNEIGLAIQGERDFPGSATALKERKPQMSTWQRIKGFFTGQPEMYDESDYDNFFGHLNLASDQSMYYRSGLGKGGAVVTVNATGRRQEDARKILSSHDADLRTSGFERVEAGARMPEQRIQLFGEMMRIVKERVQRGEVRLRKEVVTEQKTINVPVSREEVVVEHVPAPSVPLRQLAHGSKKARKFASPSARNELGSRKSPLLPARSALASEPWRSPSRYQAKHGEKS